MATMAVRAISEDVFRRGRRCSHELSTRRGSCRRSTRRWLPVVRRCRRRVPQEVAALIMVVTLDIGEDGMRVERERGIIRTSSLRWALPPRVAYHRELSPCLEPTSGRGDLIGRSRSSRLIGTRAFSRLDTLYVVELAHHQIATTRSPVPIHQQRISPHLRFVPYMDLQPHGRPRGICRKRPHLFVVPRAFASSTSNHVTCIRP
ncbi:hypothetical protein BD626DRAFT_151156 [Schizophyllum amplum]|uniref:Uncharacterized protein n=1 Tax=Schizophyllum amplum TaxID=97359 RepID=A0A550C462_9AGAR|nr:hypothetical protein BD626DRAFT_151156 [Auriculariopsis ampla]